MRSFARAMAAQLERMYPKNAAGSDPAQKLYDGVQPVLPYYPPLTDLHQIGQLQGAAGGTSVTGPTVPRNCVWLVQGLHAVHSDAGGPHSLLIAAFAPDVGGLERAICLAQGVVTTGAFVFVTRALVLTEGMRFRVTAEAMGAGQVLTLGWSALELPDVGIVPTVG